MNLSNPLTARRVEAIKQATSTKALTYKEIADATHTSEAYILKCMGELLGLGLVHVAEWRLFRRTYAAVYRWGAGQSAERPKAMTSTEGQRAYRERIRKDPLKNAFFLARQRAKDRVKRATKKPQTWCSALM